MKFNEDEQDKVWTYHTEQNKSHFEKVSFAF